MLKNSLENLRSAFLFCCWRDPGAPGSSTDGSLSDENKNNLRDQFKIKNKYYIHSTAKQLMHANNTNTAVLK
jgi:hypothetical protein